VNSSQTQENEFSFTREEALDHTVAKELEENPKKRKEKGWEMNGGMRLVDFP
jgi:hypothetical protein